MQNNFIYNKRVLITGGLGFIGGHMVEHFIRNTEWELIIIDKLSSATKGFDRLKCAGLLHNERIKIFTWDLCNSLSEGLIKEIGKIDIIIHLAANSHVDNSIKEPVPFVLNNIQSTLTMLEYARTLSNLTHFLYFCTDEVYGSTDLKDGFSETDRHKPTNPYSASKSCGEQLCVAYNNTYKTPVIIINCMNNMGEYQNVEKFIPKVIKSVLNNDEIEIHCDNELVPGSRSYIHSRNTSDAVLFILENGEIGENYNISGEKEINNLELAQLIATYVGKPLKYKFSPNPEKRAGHDLRYALNGNKLYRLGWKVPKTFEESLKKTVEWSLKHKEWLEW